MRNSAGHEKKCGGWGSPNNRSQAHIYQQRAESPDNSDWKNEKKVNSADSLFQFATLLDWYMQLLVRASHLKVREHHLLFSVRHFYALNKKAFQEGAYRPLF